MSFANRLVEDWYVPRITLLTALLLPLSVAFRALASVRRAWYRSGFLRTERLAVPVVVVGNIAVGGSGKTPLAIAIAGELSRRGWRPGIVSRGYGGSSAAARRVQPESNPDE